MLAAENDFTRRLESLDLSLFESIYTQSTDQDRQSWLAVQRSIRSPSGYTYLEIGSHFGGSIQQHLIDPLCRRIVSIDKRPPSQPDDRGQDFLYEGNSTVRMLDNLKRIGQAQLAKLVCFDSDAKDIDLSAIPKKADFCFIDGEHTQKAALSDFEFCLGVCSPDAAICFHDDWIIYPALKTALKILRHRRIPFTALKLGGSTFGIFLRDCKVKDDPFIKNYSMDGHQWSRQCRYQSFRTKILKMIPKWALPPIRRMRDFFKA